MPAPVDVLHVMVALPAQPSPGSVAEGLRSERLRQLPPFVQNLKKTVREIGWGFQHFKRPPGEEPIKKVPLLTPRFPAWRHKVVLFSLIWWPDEAAMASLAPAAPCAT